MKSRCTGIALFAIALVSLACAGDGEVATPSDTLVAGLASEGRPAEDRARDEGRRPVDVVRFLGVEPGMTVLDLIAAGGYYTEVLSHAVGPTGRVYAQNNDFVLKMRGGANDRALTARLANDRLPNVVRIDRELPDIGLEPASIDLALTALNFHDIYNARGPAQAASFLSAVHDLLQPGGVLGLIDHSGGVGDDKQLHRIDELKVEKAAVHAGFVIEAKSDVLRNASDDRTLGVFAPGLRGNTDRFVLRLRKP